MKESLEEKTERGSMRLFHKFFPEMTALAKFNIILLAGPECPELVSYYLLFNLFFGDIGACGVWNNINPVEKYLCTEKLLFYEIPKGLYKTFIRKKK